MHYDGRAGGRIMSIIFKHVSHTYNADSPFSYIALDDIDLEIMEGKVTAIIGETGSGKTTLVQHLNALLLPTSGEIEVLDKVISSKEKPKNLKELRKNVGLVFQFPEYQLFEETILKDVCFGPKNFGMQEEDAKQRATEILQICGMDETYLEKSPFDLSGGQKRRVAIAGILAMDPSVLVLDEPTAGLDPQGAKEMMQLFVEMNEVYHKTVLIVTHDMEHVLTYCERVVVVKDGHIERNCEVQDFFKDVELLHKLGIQPPHVIALREQLRLKGFHLDESIIEIEHLAKRIAIEVNGHE